MNGIKITGAVLFMALLVATSMYALTSVLDSRPVAQPRLLLAGDPDSSRWQRMVAGAQDAAREHGYQLVIEALTPVRHIDQQASVVCRAKPADYDGSAIFVAKSRLEAEFFSNSKHETKVVTVDRDIRDSQRLCHIGYNQERAGHVVATLISGQLARPGKVLLLATTLAKDVQNADVHERLIGFRELWEATEHNNAFPCFVVQAAIESENGKQLHADLSALLADSALAFIVTLDSNAGAVVLQELAKRPNANHASIVAFDPDNVILDAIDDGRIGSAIFDDPYCSGFTAIERLGNYYRSSDNCLPKPGCGCHFLGSEIVTKVNLNDVRRRIGTPPVASKFSTARNVVHPLGAGSSSRSSPF